MQDLMHYTGFISLMNTLAYISSILSVTATSRVEASEVYITTVISHTHQSYGQVFSDQGYNLFSGP